MSDFIRHRRFARRGPGFPAAIAVALLCAVQAGAQNPGPTKWTNTIGGVWSDGTSWSNGVPNSNDVWLTLTGVSYIVTYDTPTNDFRDLTISNSVGFISTLTITSSAFAPVGNVLLSSGAVVNVNTGGIWKPTIGTNANVSIEVKAGAVLNIAGGSIIYSNMPPTNDVSLILSDSSANGTSVLNLTSGQIELCASTNYVSSARVLSLGGIANKSGIMNISGGKCTLQAAGHNADTVIGSGAGGRGYLNITGGEFVITNSPGFAGEGIYLEIGYSGSGAYGEVNVSGSGKFTKMNNKTFWIGRSGEGRINVDGGTVYMIGTMYVGARGTYGTGIVTVTSGTFTYNSAAYLGYEQYSSDIRNSGYLNIYGGLMDIGSTIYAGYASAGATNKIGRVTVTNGILNNGSHIYVGSVGNLGVARGELIISDNGIFTNAGPLYVGYTTNATGIFNQSGGRYHLINTQIGAIGDNGGNGTYNLSNGWAKMHSYLYVGGKIGSNSVGALNISGGTLETENTFYIGEAGTGTLSMVGSQGALTVPSLVATTSTSRISFDLGPNGAGTVTVSSAVSISTNANLEITVTSYDFLANGLNVDLISYGTLTGTFGTNVTLIGGAGRLDGGSVTYGSGTSDKIRLQLRPAVGTIFYMR